MRSPPLRIALHVEHAEFTPRKPAFNSCSARRSDRRNARSGLLIGDEQVHVIATSAALRGSAITASGTTSRISIVQPAALRQVLHVRLRRPFPTRAGNHDRIEHVAQREADQRNPQNDLDDPADHGASAATCGTTLASFW